MTAPSKPIEHWINISHSNGFELQLFNRKYTVWLSCKPENYDDTSEDAELIIEALNSYQGLKEEHKKLLDTLEKLAAEGITEVLEARKEIERLRKALSASNSAYDLLKGAE